VLKNIDLTINPGETVAFIGPVGSGKSTVSNLLIRLFDTKERGQLLIDGMDIADIPLKTLRANIGYIPQDNFLFSDTIRYNIAFTPEDLKDEEVEEAAKASDIYDTIMNLPDKWETLLGEKGVNLSGGQKQRLCIARAIAKNAPIMIFDDCLSAVDMETESRILKSLKDVQSNRTCIIIAHRISTVKNADKIVVLNKGRIVEMGNHEELLEKRGYYYKAYSIQLLEQQYGAGLRNKEGVRA
jgi:ATP-binding cassette subfamily B multidrug efflux pump